MRVAVIGLGKIGLPLAAQYASKGHQVVGVDIDEGTVEAVNAGREPFPGEFGLAERLAELTVAGRLRATVDYADAVPPADAVVVVVPLFVDVAGTPDFGWMDAATGNLGANLTAGTLVLYETTLPVGTTRGRWKPALEAASGLTEGKDFYVAFSPERVLTGRVFADLRKYPKLVGGLSGEGALRAVAFYEAVLDFDERSDLEWANGVWDLGSAEAAEMAKLVETTYRDVNIGLANQFARFASRAGIDVVEVIRAANSQPYSHIHQPGIAVGGHCIPVYPHLYLSTDPDATIVRSARKANSEMPAHAVDLLGQAYGDLTGTRTAILGAAYRGGVKETAFSGVFPLAEALEARGATVLVHDPLFDDDELAALSLQAYHYGQDIDAVVIQADHDEYRRLDPCDLPGVKVIVDGRAVLPASDEWSAVTVLRLGAPAPRSDATERLLDDPDVG